MGVDDEPESDEKIKSRAPRARTHPLPTPRPRESCHVGRRLETRKKLAQAPREERRHLSHEDRSIARARPADSSPIRSPSNGLSSGSLASLATSSTNARNAQASKAPGIHLKLNPWMSKGAKPRECSGCSAKQGGPNAIGLMERTRKKQVSNPPGKKSNVTRKISSERLNGPGCDAKYCGPNAIGVSPSLHSIGTEHTRKKQVSNPPGKRSKSIRQTSSERLVCPGCAVKHCGSDAFGSNSSLCSKGTAHTRNKPVLESSGIQSTMKPKMRMSRLLRLRPNAQQDGSNTMALNSPVDSKRIVGYKQAYKQPEIQPRSHAFQQEGITGQSPRKSRGVRMPSNELSGQNHVSVASTKNSYSGRGANGRSAAAFPRENATRRRSESTADSLSSLSSSRTSTVHPRNPITARNRINPVYRGGRHHGSHYYSEGDESSQDSLDLSRGIEKVVDSIRTTARDILSSDVEDVWLSGAVLKGIAESKKVSVDTLMESVSDKLDDLEDSLFGTTDERKKQPAKSWFPMEQLSVKW